jgi:hypothetical protein
MLEVLPTPLIGLDFRRVTAVQEFEVDKKLLHIARVPYKSSKACWAMHAVTKNKCTAKNRLQFQEHPCPGILWSLKLLQIHNI